MSAKAVGYASLAATVAAIAFLFYFGGFAALLSNESSSVIVERRRAESRAHRDASIVVLGNSTAAEDFRTNYFNAHSPGRTALNLGVPGGHIYLFERMLAESMREGVRPRTLILIVTPELLSLRPDFDYLLNDLTMLKVVLNSSDLVRLAAQSRSLYDYTNYAGYVVLRPVLFGGELRDFLSHPAARLREAGTVRNWLASFGPQTPLPESDDSFAVCQVGPLSRLLRQRRETLPADYQRVAAGYAVRVHQPLQVDAFETWRLRRLLEQLTQTAPAVYVTGAPYYDPDFDQYPAEYRRSFEAALSQVANGVRGVTLLPAFPAGCEMFADTVHLNRAGAEQFTEYLHSRVI